MKKFLLVCLFLILLFPIPNQYGGAYNTFSQTFACRSLEICRHEIGHVLDFTGGNASQSPEFRDAIQMYLLVELRKPTLEELPVKILRMSLDSNPRELYAFLYQYSEGNPERLPESLRKFFDFQKGERIYTKIGTFEGWFFGNWHLQ